MFESKGGFSDRPYNHPESKFFTPVFRRKPRLRFSIVFTVYKTRMTCKPLPAAAKFRVPHGRQRVEGESKQESKQANSGAHSREGVIRPTRTGTSALASDASIARPRPEERNVKYRRSGGDSKGTAFGSAAGDTDIGVLLWTAAAKCCSKQPLTQELHPFSSSQVADPFFAQKPPYRLLRYPPREPAV